MFESYNQNIANIDSRLYSAEQQIEPQAITTTVMSQTSFQDAMDELKSTTIQQTKDDLSVQIATANHLGPSVSWFHFDTDQNDNPVFRLGTTANDFSSEFSNTALSFKQNDQTVAYISNSKLFITTGEFTNGFKIGNLNAIIDNSDGSVNWSWSADA